MKVILETVDGETFGTGEAENPGPELRAVAKSGAAADSVTADGLPLVRLFRFVRYVLGPAPDRNLEAAVYREVPA